MRRIASGLEGLSAALRDMRLSHVHDISSGAPVDASGERRAINPYSIALAQCRRAANDRAGAEGGRYDSHIRTVLSNYLASKYPGASQESIEQHAESRMRQIGSWCRVTAWNTVGTATTALLTSIAPKLGIAMGTNAAVAGATIGTTLGSALIPAALAALPIAGALGASYLAHRYTRDSRESRKAGKILEKAMQPGSRSLEDLRKALAGGADIFNEFDKLIKKHDLVPEKVSSKLWTLGMIGTGGLLGTFGAGSIDIASDIAASKGGWMLALADWRQSAADFASKFFYQSEAVPGAWQTGVRELNELGKYFLTHLGAMFWLNKVPQPPGVPDGVWRAIHG
jgi:hypothetical protein